MPGRKILVIDDEQDVQVALRAILERAGYRVSSARDGMQAQMMARQVSPDLIILDINMPGGGGYTAFERLRMMNTTVGIPVLVYTVVPKEDVDKRIPESPSTAFLSKPASPEVLVEAVRKLLTPD